MLVMGTLNCGRVAHAVENSLHVHLLQYIMITINRKQCCGCKLNICVLLPIRWLGNLAVHTQFISFLSRGYTRILNQRNEYDQKLLPTLPFFSTAQLQVQRRRDWCQCSSTATAAAFLQNSQSGPVRELLFIQA